MRIRRSLTCLVLTILVLTFSAALVLGQGGTGKLPPPGPRMPPPIHRTPPPRKSPAPGPSCSARAPKQATGRTQTVDLIDGVKLELVEVPAGNFCMGSENGTAAEKPVHRVTIGKAFYIGKYEVTQQQWRAVMGSNPSSFKNCGDNCPVENISWDDAQRFVTKLNEKNDGFRYRLPTEAEWEYSCRAGTTGDYAGDLNEMSWFGRNSGGTIHPVGQKKMNAWGLADMHGNVFEICEDWYHESYLGAPTDGRPWLAGGPQKARVVRGSSYLSVDRIPLRSAGRGYAAGPGPIPGLGFRVVAEARN